MTWVEKWEYYCVKIAWRLGWLYYVNESFVVAYLGTHAPMARKHTQKASSIDTRIHDQIASSELTSISSVPVPQNGPTQDSDTVLTDLRFEDLEWTPKDSPTPETNESFGSTQGDSRSPIAVLQSRFVNMDVHELVRLCHALAIPIVEYRLWTDEVISPKVELDISALSFDFIAELFAPADQLEFRRLVAHFEGHEVPKPFDDEVVKYLRPLISSLVNRGLFRFYNEVDPTLGRIIRNIKLALTYFDSLVQTDLLDIPCLALAETRLDDGKRMMEFEELKVALQNYLNGTENIPFMLGKLALLLGERQDVSKAVPLVLAARTFRSLLIEHPPVKSADGLDSRNLASLVRDTVRAVKAKVTIEYSEGGGVDRWLVETYFKVIEERLMLIYSADGVVHSLRRLLAKHLPGMSSSEYATEHRDRLQHLEHLAQREVQKRLLRK